jgi:hypothetical protein
VKKIPVIRDETWNSMVNTIGRRLPIRFEAGPNPRKWSHPWKITPSWQEGVEGESKGQWLFKIKPGFVNGVEVEIPTRVKNASARTLSRLAEADEEIKNSEQTINAFLTEWPLVEIGETRVIGTGAEATGMTEVESSGSVGRLTYEAVPKFFSDLGVTSANTQITGNIDDGISFIRGQEDIKTARRLRACDISLWKDRLSAKVEIYPGSLEEGIVGAIQIVYNNERQMKKNAYLRVQKKFVPPKEPTSPLELIGGTPDPEYDFTKLATIYFVSPEGVEPAAELDSSWTPYVEYNHFWNLAHSPQKIPDLTPIEPIRLPVPLAGGVATGIINNILAPFNNQLNTALQILKSRSMKGAFWSL